MLKAIMLLLLLQGLEKRKSEYIWITWVLMVKYLQISWSVMHEQSRRVFCPNGVEYVTFETWSATL
jgi:hypothetical protein